MPNVLWDLQGTNKVTFAEETVNGQKLASLRWLSQVA